MNTRTGGIRAARITVPVLTAICLLAAACAASGETSPATSAAHSSTVSLIPGDAQGPAAKDMANVGSVEGISLHRYFYAVQGGHPDPRQNWMDVYLPHRKDTEHGDNHQSDTPQQNGTLPLVILIHGGSWQAKIGANSFATFARRLAERDLAVVNIEYRRVGNGGGWPTTFDDVAAAMDAMPQVAQRYPQIDLRDAVVVGHSAGAQLAVWSSTRHKLDEGEVGADPAFRPVTVIALAGPLDMRRAVQLGDTRIVRVLGGTPRQVPDRYASVDPIQNIDPDTPVIAIAGSADRVVPHVLSQEYVTADKAAGGHAEAIILPGQTHGSIVDPKTRAFTEIIEIITRVAHDTHRGE
ncbi:alpha/beta fold hydrolase [Gordonia sp. NPDC003429]